MLGFRTQRNMKKLKKTHKIRERQSIVRRSVTNTTNKDMTARYTRGARYRNQELVLGKNTHTHTHTHTQKKK